MTAPDRRERYAAALYTTLEVSPFHTPWEHLGPLRRAVWYARAEAAMAIADSEQAMVRTERDDARRLVNELACPTCKGSGLDPDDEGDWDGGVGRHNPNTIGPCPTCMGDRTRQGSAR